MKRNHRSVQILIFSFFILINTLIASNGRYISFGIRLGYEFGKGSSYTFKTGYGIFKWFECSSDVFCEGPPFESFKSISFGYRIRYGKDRKNYFFTDFQFGNYIGGAGVGIAMWKKNEHWQLIPRSSIFGGLAIWGTFDLVFTKEINPDIGVQILLPLPFEE